MSRHATFPKCKGAETDTELYLSAGSVQVDLTKRRVVDEGEGRLWAESRGFHYFETSAQSGEGISEMFQVRYVHMLSGL